MRIEFELRVNAADNCPNGPLHDLYI